MLNYRREETATSKINTMVNKVEPSKAWRKDSTIETKGKAKIQSNYNSDIKCFKHLRSGHIAS
jgi:Asp-tRNA(Asn)/Glu-tRNA(Gln) amidotransferase C subunit